MDLYILIIGLCLCLLATSIYLHFRLKKEDVNCVLLRVLASFCFLATAMLISSSKNTVVFYNSYAISCIIIGLICSTISSCLLEFKNIYPFHEKKYYLSGFVGNLVSNLINIIAVVLVANNTLNIFSKSYILPLVLILVGAVILAIAIYFMLTKALKLDLKIFKIQTFFNLFILCLNAIFAIYIAFVSASLPLLALSIAFVLATICNVFLTIKNFSEITNNNHILTYNILYFLTSVAIILFIYFI